MDDVPFLPFFPPRFFFACRLSVFYLNEFVESKKEQDFNTVGPSNSSFHLGKVFVRLKCLSFSARPPRCGRRRRRRLFRRRRHR